ncbi:hypothetical protein GCM10009000_091980 [Halobacterium noricense]
MQHTAIVRSTQEAMKLLSGQAYDLFMSSFYDCMYDQHVRCELCGEDALTEQYDIDNFTSYLCDDCRKYGKDYEQSNFGFFHGKLRGNGERVTP